MPTGSNGPKLDAKVRGGTVLDPAIVSAVQAMRGLYVAFDRPARGLVHQADIKLLDSKDMAVENAFMDFGQELWSPDGKRLTVLFDPGKIKRGVEAPHSELAPLKEGGNIQNHSRKSPARLSCRSSGA